MSKNFGYSQHSARRQSWRNLAKVIFQLIGILQSPKDANLGITESVDDFVLVGGTRCEESLRVFFED